MATGDFTYNLMTPVILAYPNTLIAPKPFIKLGKAQGEPKYGAMFVFEADNPDLPALKKLALACARAKFTSRDVIAEAKAGTFHFPFTDGTKECARLTAANPKKDYKWMNGRVLVPARSKYETKLAGIENGKVVDYTTPETRLAAQGKFFFGALVLAQFNFWPYEGFGGGVTAYLNMVFSTGKGTRIAGGPSASEVFKGYQGTLTAEDPAGGGPAHVELDDEIPF